MESDAEFVERIKREWDGDNVPCVEDFDQLIALARRGVEAAARIEQLEAEAKSRTLDYLGQVGQLSEEIERLRAALREIVAMDEVALVEFKKGDGWLHQRVARAALEGK